jgi:hypothetical protein
MTGRIVMTRAGIGSIQENLFIQDIQLDVKMNVCLPDILSFMKIIEVD